MDQSNRLILLVLEVADLGRSVALYGDGFGLDLHMDDHSGDDRWISGGHGSASWSAGAFLHFALYQAKRGACTSGAQLGFAVDDLDAAHTKAVAAGATLIHGPRPEPWGATSRYYDLDANVVSLTQRAVAR